MKPLARIFNRIDFIRAEFAPDGGFSRETWLWRPGELAPAGCAVEKNVLTAAVVCGHGVVTKPDDAQITARIKADPGTFLWSSANGQTSFVRRERLQPLLDDLTGEGIVAVRIFCLAEASDLETSAEEFARQLSDGLRWKSLLKPAAESSSVLQVLVRRAGLPVLGLFLCLLAGNALLSPQFNARRQALQSEIAARERTASTAASAGVRQREQLAAFAARPRTSRSVLCDRIAGAVPDRVVLTQLAVEPLTKRFETGKPLQRREGAVVVSGAASSASDVSAFVQRLSETGVCRDVRLANVEKERDGDRLVFTIECSL